LTVKVANNCKFTYLLILCDIDSEEEEEEEEEEEKLLFYGYFVFYAGVLCKLLPFYRTIFGYNELPL
jgi:hypothetical protein